jgi:hypothetical protein
VRVIALWADATAGLPLLPTDFWSATFPAGSVGCGPLSAASSWHLVDTANPCRTIPVVNPALPEVVSFEWDVPMSAADHSCMLVIVESDDDPIDTAVRTTNERQLDVLVPNHRQIGLRNLHVVDGSPAPMRGMMALQVPNHDRERPEVSLILSRAGLPKEVSVGLILPTAAPVHAQGLKAGPWDLSPDQAASAKSLKLDPSQVYTVTGQEAILAGLPVPPGSTWTIGVVYDSHGAIKPGTAGRFTILQMRGKQVVGGSTYVLRVPARK